MTSHTILKLLARTIKLIAWSHRNFTFNETRPMREYVTLMEHFTKVLRTRGVDSYIAYVKAIRNAFYIYLSGEYSFAKQIPGVRYTFDGIPTALGPFIPMIRQGSSPDLLRVIMTILSMNRALRLESKPDLSPIEDPCKKAIPHLGDYSKSFWNKLGYRQSKSTLSAPRKTRFKSWHLSTKAGPNGHALWNCFSDLNLIKDNPLLLQYLKLLGGKRFPIDALIKALPQFAKVLPTNGTSLRKLAHFPDKEGKTRVIAIGDYFSQAVLKPLHEYLMETLKKIPQDCTFNQAGFAEKIAGWEIYYSIDLTAATDRFPIETIIQALSGHFPHTYLEAWRYIMVSLPFKYEGKDVRYSVGNPMGFYSSWASFAVAHHFVMYCCCRELSIPFETAKYCLLGDDILIGDHALAKKYMEMISSLGVEFSPLKTHTSSEFLEFAKRLFYKGTEISPFPISSLEESQKSFYLMVNLLIELEAKGWKTVNGVSLAVSTFYQDYLGFNATYAAKTYDKSLFCEHMTYVMRGVKTAAEGLNFLIGHFEYPIRQLSDEEGMGILSNVAVESFAASNPANLEDNHTGYPLGRLAEDLVIFVQLNEDVEAYGSSDEFISYIPHLSVYGQICESYQRVSREAFRIDTTGGGDWPILLKTMALPLDDRIFTQRSSHLISKASSIIGKHLRTRFEFLASPLGRSMLG